MAAEVSMRLWTILVISHVLLIFQKVGKRGGPTQGESITWITITELRNGIDRLNLLLTSPVQLLTIPATAPSTLPVRMSQLLYHSPPQHPQMVLILLIPRLQRTKPDFLPETSFINRQICQKDSRCEQHRRYSCELQRIFLNSF